ncbi:MAG: hypothetical protein ACT4O9_01415, partial [Blastocatellia bacterium]
VSCILNHDQDEKSSNGQGPTTDISCVVEAPSISNQVDLLHKEQPILFLTDPYISPPPNLPFQPPKTA